MPPDADGGHRTTVVTTPVRPVQQPGVIATVVTDEDLSARWGILGESVPHGGHRLVRGLLGFGVECGPRLDLGSVPEEEADGLVLDPVDHGNSLRSVDR